MYNRKSMIIIALMAMILLGSVFLNAITYNIIVHVNAVPDNSFFKIGHPGNWYLQGNLHEGSNSFTFESTATGYRGWAWANVGVPLPDADSDSQDLNWPGTTHFYLDINGNEIYDPYSPIIK